MALRWGNIARKYDEDLAAVGRSPVSEVEWDPAEQAGDGLWGPHGGAHEGVTLDATLAMAAALGQVASMKARCART